MIGTCLHDNVLEVILANAPVNALSAGVRQGLAKAIADGQNDEAVPPG